MYQNRVEKYFAAMAKSEAIDDEVETTPEAEPKNVFAKNLCEFMGLAGMDADELAKATGIDKDRIRQLRSSGIPSVGKARKPKELKLIADALGTTIKALFAEQAPAILPMMTPPKIDEMVNAGLSGPKKSFLMDAIEMAYIAAIASRSNY